MATIKNKGLQNVISRSEYKDNSFSDAYGVRMTEGPLVALLSRAVVVLDTDVTVLYTEQIPEIGQEPDYDAALAYLR